MSITQKIDAFTAVVFAINAVVALVFGNYPVMCTTIAAMIQSVRLAIKGAE